MMIPNPWMPIPFIPDWMETFNTAFSNAWPLATPAKPKPRSEAPTELAPYTTVQTQPTKCSNWFKNPDENCEYDTFKLALVGVALVMLMRKQ